MSYKSNSPYEIDKVFASNVPGSYVNGFKLAFYENQKNSSIDLSPVEFKNMIVDSLKLLKEAVDELKDSNCNLKKDYNNLLNQFKNLNRESTKSMLRLKYFESELRKLKINNDEERT